MNVAYIIPSIASPCGWRTFTLGALEALRKYINPILFVSQKDYSTALSAFPELAVFPLAVTQDASFSQFRGSLNLAQTFFQIQFIEIPPIDLVHSLEAYPTGLIGDWLAKRIGCPHILTAHGTYALVWHNSFLDNKVYQCVLARADMVCPVSHGTAQYMQELFGKSLSKTKIYPILNGNDYYLNVQREVAFGRDFSQPVIFLSVGEVKPRKGQLNGVQAFARVCMTYPQSQYWIVGDWKDNEYTRKIKNFIADHHLEGVKIFGRVENDALQDLFRQASVLLLTPQPQSGKMSLHIEGFGLVFLEAGAYGLPVIGTRFGGVPDAVKDGETGFLVEPGNVNQLSEAMLRLIQKPRLAQKMGRANRAWAETLTWERYAGEQYNVYREAIYRP